MNFTKLLCITIFSVSASTQAMHERYVSADQEHISNVVHKYMAYTRCVVRGGKGQPTEKCHHELLEFHKANVELLDKGLRNIGAKHYFEPVESATEESEPKQ